MSDLVSFILARAPEGLLSWAVEVSAVQTLGASHAAVERAALESGILPARYQRNRRAISLEQQLKLFSSTVAVVGCGGLGGYAIEELARLGIGRIVALDPDVFEEHNLNRQLLSDPATLGRPKVEAAADRVRIVNPAVTLVPVMASFSAENGAEQLKGAHVAVDALDSIFTRRELGKTCSGLGIPLVHGSIAGWYGQIAVQFPGDPTLETLYCRCVEDKGIERDIGNPAFTPAVVASFQAAETCKVLLGIGAALRRRVLCIDLLAMTTEEIVL